MKNYFNKITTKLFLISLTILLIISFNNDYMSFKDRECLVIDKIQSDGSYKSSVRFYLILKEKSTGINFDLIVNPTTYTLAQKNDIKIFNLRDFDIQQNHKDNIIYFIGTCIFISLTIVFFVGSFINLKNI